MGKTLLYGMLVAIPTLIIAGPLFAMTLKQIRAQPAEIFRSEPKPLHELPGAFASFFTALLPVALLAALTLATLLRPELTEPLAFFSNPLTVMLASYVVAMFTLGLSRGMTLPQVMASAQEALREIAPILLIIAGAGGLKQVMTESGISAQLGA